MVGFSPHGSWPPVAMSLLFGETRTSGQKSRLTAAFEKICMTNVGAQTRRTRFGVHSILQVSNDCKETASANVQASTVLTYLCSKAHST